MKNKKLFAILTLVCFMFTLMPVAAFAATDADAYVTDVTGDDEVSVRADEKVTVKVTDGATNGEYYFWAENEDGDVEELKTTATTSSVFEFDAVGTYYVYAVNKTVVDVADMAKEYYGKAAIVEYIKDVDNYIDDCLTVKVKKSNAEYKLNGPESVTVVADNGWTGEKEVVVQLTKADGTAVKGEEITFTTNSSYVDVAVEDEITNRNGKVEITITATRAGDYKVYAHADNADKLTINVNAVADVYGDITTIAEPARNIALDTDLNGKFFDIAFEVEFADGTLIEEEDGKKVVTNEGTRYDLVDKEGSDFLYKVTIVEAPADSELKDVEAGDLWLTWNNNANAWVLNSNGLSLDEEGTYTFKVTMENGTSAKATVKVVEFDEAVRMILTMKANTVSYGETVEVKSVSYMDANGTLLTKAHKDYRAGEYMNIEYAASGKAVAEVSKEGAITAKGADKDGDELIGTTITAFAINEDLELTATATITVVDQAAELKYQSTTADIAVNNKLIVNPVDENGNVIATLDTVKSKASVYVLSAPANAAYSAEAKVTDTDEVTVTFTASAAGEYELQTVVRTEGAYLSSVDTITVGGATGTFKDVVVMSIGSANVVVNSDVKEIAAAPMIQDGRTFVPFRALAEAFGADVEWVEATQSVVAELNGVKVVMNIGENAYTVDGVAKTADVAPFINGASTMVPVRFVAEAFGINVTPIYAENGAVADVLFAK